MSYEMIKHNIKHNHKINKIIEKLKEGLNLKYEMKCKFCGSENTKEITVTYIGNLKGINRHALAECKDCSRAFGYVSKTEIPKIISTKYSEEIKK